MKIVVVGAGASGLMASIQAARKGASVTVLEKMEKPGRKLLATGNGRCNLTNRNQSVSGAYKGSHPAFAEGVLQQFPVSDTLTFFHELGILLKERDGYIYPYTDQAATVLEALILESKSLGVRLKYREEVTGLEALGGGWKVETRTWKYECDKVILSAGSAAAPVTGSDGSGYELAKRAGHHVVPPLPALVPLKVKEHSFFAAAGVRSHVGIRLYVNGKLCGQDEGELQWTAYGLSGIVVFQLSHEAVRALEKRKQVLFHIDLLPDYPPEEIESCLKDRAARHPAFTAESLLNGVFPKKLRTALLKLHGWKPDRLLSEEEIHQIITGAKNIRLHISGYPAFELAQVCSGGVDTTEVDGNTLESKLVKGLYLTGELLDIDGICGGYNLQWAWSTGYVAGVHAAASQMEHKEEEL